MDVFALMATLGLDSTEYEDGLKEAGESGRSFTQKIGSTLKKAGKVAGVGLAAAGTAVMAFGKSSINTGMEFDVSMSQIAATLGMSVEDIENNIDGAGDTFQKLRSKAKQMGSATNFTAKQAAEGLNILAMSGYDATQSMDMIEDVLHLAAAGSMDMASAAGYVSGSMKGFNDSTKDSGYYADLMAKGATLANTSVAQLGEALSGGAAGAKAYGQSAETTTVALLRLAEQGEVGSAAGTSLAAAMKNLYSPTDQAAAALKELGVATYTSSGESRDFNTVVNELDAALSGYTDEQKAAYKQTIFGIQGLDAYNKMTVTGVDKQNEWAAALRSASDGAGEAAKQYETMTDNLQGDIDIFNSAVDGLKIAVSDKLTPSLREFVQFGSNAVGELAAAFEEKGLNGAMEALGNIIAQGTIKLIAGIPAFISAGASLISGIVLGFKSNFPLLLQAGKDVVDTIIGSVSLFLHLRAPGIGNLFDTFVSGIQSSFETLGSVWTDTLEPAFTNLSDAITNLVGNEESLTGFGTVVDDAFGAVNSIISDLGKALADVVDFFADIFGNEETATAWQGIMESVFNVVHGVINAVKRIVNAVRTAFDKFFGNEERAKTYSTSLSDLFGKIEGALTSIGEAIESVIDWFVDLWAEDANATAFGTAIDSAFNMVVTVVGSIAEGIAAVIDWFAKLFADEGLSESYSTVLQTYYQAIADIFDDISTAILKVIAWFKHLFKQEGPSSAFADAVKAAFDLIVKIIQRISSGIRKAINWFGSLFDNQSDAESYASDVESIFTSVKDIINAISTAIDSLIDAFSDLFFTDSALSTYASAVKSIFGGIVSAIKDVSAAAAWALQTLNALFSFDFSSPLSLPNAPMLGGSAASVASQLIKRQGGGGSASRGSGAGRNASAMDEGRIFNHAAIFGYADGKYQIAGDVGAEAVVGVRSLRDMVRQSVADTMGGMIAQMTGILADIRANMPTGDLVLDTGALVGGIAEDMDVELNRVASWKGGGHA